MGRHSVIGGSGWSRWSVCPASAALGRYAEPEPSSSFADEGTVFHAGVERLLFGLETPEELIGRRFPLDPDPFLGHETFGVFNAEMARHAQPVLDYVDAWIAEHGFSWIKVEHFFERPDIHRDYFSTVDNVVWSRDRRRVLVLDLKYGAGLSVDIGTIPQPNGQLAYYATGVGADVADYIDLVVYQPRMAPEPAFRGLTLTGQQLQRWAYDRLSPALDRVDAATTVLAEKGPEALEYHPSVETCRYCPARLLCPAQAAIRAKAGVKASSTVPLERLSVDQLEEIIELEAHIKKQAASARNVLVNRAVHGEAELQKTKVVFGKSNRVWKEGAEAELRARIGSAAYTISLKTPAQLEDIDRKIVSELAYSPPSSLTLVSQSDRREPANITARSAQRFAAILPQLKE